MLVVSKPDVMTLHLGVFKGEVLCARHLLGQHAPDQHDMKQPRAMLLGIVLRALDTQGSRVM